MKTLIKKLLINPLSPVVQVVFILIVASPFLIAHAEAQTFSCENHLQGKSLILSDLLKFQDLWRKEVGLRLSSALNRKSLSDEKTYSKAQLSRDIQVDNSSVAKYSKGIFSIPLVHAQNISRILNVELKWLLAQDLLVAFNVNGLKVQPEDFRGHSMQALSDAFSALVWSQPEIIDHTEVQLRSEIDPQIFCIEDCQTEDLVRELARRGWDVNLRLKY